MNAGNRILINGAARHGFANEFPVAAKTCLLQNVRIARLYRDGFMEVLKGEALRMVETIDRICDIFLDERVRQLTVGAGCHDMMARLHP